MKSRTLTRPMFRIGGSAGTGITSGLDQPRKELRQGTNPYDMGNFAPGTFPGFLTGFGLDLLSRPPSGNIFQTAALSARGPFRDFQSANMARAKAQAERDFLISEREAKQKFYEEVDKSDLDPAVADYLKMQSDLQFDSMGGSRARTSYTGMPFVDLNAKEVRDQLLALVTTPAERFRLVNLLLALLPYTRPGQFQIERATDLLPDWFISDYADHCDPELRNRLVGPAGLLNPAEPVEEKDAPSADEALPIVSERRGQDVINLVTSADEQRRIKALITLYGLAPDDAETLQELSDLRRIVAQVWLDVEPSQLETLNNGPLGEITWNLIRSGFGAEIIGEKDQQTRQQLTALADTIYRPERHGLLLATLLFVRLEGTSIERTGELPQWLVDALRRLQ